MSGEAAPRRFTDEERLRTSPASRDHPATPLTDDEAAFLRHARFGTWPLRPQELVESVESDQPGEVPPQAFDPRDWGEAGRLL